MSYVIQPTPQSSLAVANSSDRFPVRRIFCVGRNYEEHVVEMGNDTREAPFFFTKPADAVMDSPCTMPYPTLTNNLHHEIEMVIAIGKAGSDIASNEVQSQPRSPRRASFSRWIAGRGRSGINTRFRC